MLHRGVQNSAPAPLRCEGAQSHRKPTVRLQWEKRGKSSRSENRKLLAFHKLQTDSSDWAVAQGDKIPSDLPGKQLIAAARERHGVLSITSELEAPREDSQTIPFLPVTLPIHLTFGKLFILPKSLRGTCIFFPSSWKIFPKLCG